MWPYKLMGNDQLSPTLFLHGYLGSASDWIPVAERLTGQFFCILPDLPGHGKNVNIPLSQPLTFDVVATGLLHLLDTLNLAQVNLAGYSMGGRLALYFALKYPQRVSSLLLEGAHPGLADKQLRQERADLDDRRAVQLRRDGIDAFVEQWYTMSLFCTLKKYPALLEQTKARRKQNNPHWAAKIISNLSPGRQPPLWSRLGKLSMPVTVIAGVLDKKYAALAKEMAQKIPQSRVEIVPGAGHNVHLEKPDSFAACFNT